MKTLSRLLLLLALAAAPLSAQDTEAQPESGVGEIIVTAQKREQNLQEVPLAISVKSR